jgi:hypothetical protein
LVRRIDGFQIFIVGKIIPQLIGALIFPLGFTALREILTVEGPNACASIA